MSTEKKLSPERKFKIAKPLAIVPAILAAVIILCMIMAVILEGPTDKGTAYAVFSVVGVILSFALPLPCIAAAVVSIVFTAAARKANLPKTSLFILLGVIDLAVFAALAVSVIRVLILKNAA